MSVAGQVENRRAHRRPFFWQFQICDVVILTTFMAISLVAAVQQSLWLVIVLSVVGFACSEFISKRPRLSEFFVVCTVLVVLYCFFVPYGFIQE